MYDLTEGGGHKFCKFCRKTPVLEPLFYKVAVLNLHFYQKETLAQVFSCEFLEALRTPSLQNTSGRLLLLFDAFRDIFILYSISQLT